MGVSVSVGVAVMDDGRIFFLIVHRRWRRRGRGLLKHADVLWGRRRRRGRAVCYWEATEREKVKTLYSKYFTVNRTILFVYRITISHLFKGPVCNI